MFKVLLVDDEPVVLKALKVLIDWANLGYAICGEAANGKQALQMIERDVPDVVITDLRMPAMSGLSLIGQCRAHGYQNMCFIILSGYGDFQNAQQAIRLGVVEYLLKPLDEEALTDTLLRMRKKLEEARASKCAGEQRNWSLFKARLRSLFAMEESVAVDEGQDFPELAGYAHLRLLKVKLLEPQREAAATLAALEEYLERDWHGAVVDRDEGGAVLLCPFEVECPETVRAQLSALLAGVQKELGVRTAILASNSASRVQDLRTAQRALRQIDVRYGFYEPGAILLYEDFVDRWDAEAFYDISWIDTVVDQVACCDQSGISDALDAMFERMHRDFLSVDSVKMLLNGMAVAISRLIKDYEGDYQVLLKRNATYIEVLETSTAEEAKRNTHRLCLKAVFYIQECQRRNVKGIISDIEQYIRRNYASDIHLRAVAEHFHINAAYLGQLFSKRMGVSYNTFLNQIRIEAAKKLLITSNLRVYEIAERVGYKNADYFVSKFQQIAGKTPTEYRQVSSTDH